MTGADWVPPVAPAELSSPWATVPVRGGDGLYTETESGRRLSLDAWRDRFARHHEQGRPRWKRSADGTLYIPDGDRFAFLWPVLGTWSAGHAATTGERDVVRLLHSVGFELARRRAEEWVLARRAAVMVDVDARLTSA
jgi:hypothetical protein